MLRFIINFILFGLLFYALWLFVPDVFSKLTGWAGALFNYIQELLNQLGGRLRTEPAQPSVTPAAPALLFLWNWFRY